MRVIQAAQHASGQMMVDTTEHRSRLYLRLLIYAQVIWVIAVGLLAREAIRVPEAIRTMLSPDTEMLVEFLTIVAPLFLFPGVFTFLLYRATLPAVRTVVLGFVEGGLTVAAFVALLPAIQ